MSPSVHYPTFLAQIGRNCKLVIVGLESIPMGHYNLPTNAKRQVKVAVITGHDKESIAGRPSAPSLTLPQLDTFSRVNRKTLNTYRTEMKRLEQFDALPTGTLSAQQSNLCRSLWQRNHWAIKEQWYSVFWKNHHLMNNAVSKHSRWWGLHCNVCFQDTAVPTSCHPSV